MKAPRRTSLFVAISSVLVVAGCSTSNESMVSVSEPVDASQPITNGQSEAAGDESSIVEDDESPVTVQEKGVLKLDSEYQALLNTLEGKQLETAAEEVMLWGDHAVLSAIGNTLLASTTFDVVDRGVELTPELSRTSYACQTGGEMIIETGNLLVDEAEYTHRTNLNNYTFSQCRVGAQLLDGSLSVLEAYESGRPYTLRKSNTVWQDFSWQKDTGVQLNVSATIALNTFEAFDTSQSRIVEIENYSMSQNGVMLEQVDTGMYMKTDDTSVNGGTQSLLMDISGRVANASGVYVQVVTEPAVSRKFVSSSLGVVDAVVDGQIQMDGDDGSRLVLRASAEGDTTALNVEVDFFGADGLLYSLGSHTIAQ